MKPRFEEHEGQLFRMLDEPVPLTPDAELPCLVRLIQDDSPMGLYNRDVAYFDVIGKLFVTQKIKENPFYSNALHAYEKNSLNQDYCIASIHTLEIIGYPVVDGSNEWALYQMMQGNKVINSNGIVPFTLTDDRIVRIDDSVSWDVGHWLRIFDDTTGWQIYKEPEPELKYKAGDFVEIINWYNGTKHLGQIDSIDHEIHIGTHRFDISGKSVMERVPQLSIIHKLKPSEVIVNIGCLSGTVDSAVILRDTFYLRHSDGSHSLISSTALDTSTRELVESLLEAMQEDK